MSSQNFDAALSLTLSFEGGYVDNRADPGGATNMGITRATLSRVRGRPVAKSEVANLSRADAARIYRKLYWDAVSGDLLPSGVDMAVFDHAVNSGVGSALRTLRLVAGIPAGQGLGDSEALIRLSSNSPDDLVRRLCAARRAFLTRLKTFKTFGPGWLARVSHLEREALALAILARLTMSSSTAARPLLSTKEEPMIDAKIQPLAAPDSKPFWASQTIWSSIAVVGSSATGAFLSWSANDMAGFGASLTALLGGVNAIVGRYRAVGPIA